MSPEGGILLAHGREPWAGAGFVFSAMGVQSVAVDRSGVPFAGDVPPFVVPVNAR